MQDERSKRRVDAWLADADAARAEVLERIKSCASLAENALKNLILVNGGAVVALFTFFGEVVKDGSDTRFARGWLWAAFGGFAVGLFAALCANVAAYITQSFYYGRAVRECELFRDLAVDGDREPSDADARDDPQRKGGLAEGTAITLVAVSTLAFLIGSGCALRAVMG